MTILVTGATGKVGSAAVRTLAAQGRDVRAFVRDATKARALAQLGAQIAVGDLTDPASIDAAIDGVTTIILVSPANPELELNTVRSAATAGVTHIVKATSKASADSPIERRRWQTQIEEGVMASGIDYTFLRSNAYMQNTLGLAKAIAATGGFGSSAGNGRIGIVDTRDVGEVAANIASDPRAHAGKTYWLTGPELIDYHQIAAILSELIGSPVEYRHTTPEQDEHTMIQAGVPAPIAHMNAQAFALTAEGDAAWITDDVHNILGRAPRSFAQFATDHVTNFRH